MRSSSNSCRASSSMNPRSFAQFFPLYRTPSRNIPRNVFSREGRGRNLRPRSNPSPRRNKVRKKKSWDVNQAPTQKRVPFEPLLRYLLCIPITRIPCRSYRGQSMRTERRWYSREKKIIESHASKHTWLVKCVFADKPYGGSMVEPWLICIFHLARGVEESGPTKAFTSR